MESKNVLSRIISLLPAEDKSIVNSLHETALSLGYTAKISPVGKKPEDWKCEYIATKPKRVLYILRITGQRFSIRAKLFHIAEYSDVLENCTEHCKASLLSASKNCKNHGGGCAGPISFTIDGKAYSKCRHFFLFADITPGDVEGIRRLLRNEAKYSANL
ncbi:hypothetical protein [Desulfocucumis palustris]|uniref:hypothetical protein n=1 Tax=Desulfocucumis palustris TaxID=1898651 RepID=UPI000CE9F7D6|nr:hypothetical protein [Desulfocucumis palustris]